VPAPLAILISSAGRRVELLGCFRRAGAELGVPVRLFAADCHPELSAACCRADQAFAVPRCGEPDFVPSLLEICARHQPALIIPTIDPELEILSAASSQFLEAGALVAVSSPEVVRIARSKTETFQFLRSIGVPTPRTILAAEAGPELPSWKFPALLKPVAGSSSIGVRRVASAGEFQAASETHATHVLQEIWEGREYTVNLYFDSTQLRCAIPHWRIETRGGEVAKAMTERVPALAPIAERLGQALAGRAFGALCFQAVVSSRGEPAVFDLNARFGGGYPLSDQAGAKFARWLLEHALGRPSTAQDQWEEGIVMTRYDASIFSKRGEPA